ncbi:MAG: methyl-accepting chemotaxis protein [Sporomusaceae bacterium]|nr:methyl-accepting chemotaxis protein [Sporomusaceae bacterium]
MSVLERFFHLKIGGKILAAAVAMVVLFVASTLYMLLQVKTIERNYEELLAYSAPLLQDVQKINTELWRQGAQVRAYLVNGDKNYVDRYRQSQRRMAELFAALDIRLRSDEAKHELKVIQIAATSYNQTLDQGILVRDKLGTVEIANFLDRTGSRAETIDGLSNDFIVYIENDIEASRRETAAAIADLNRKMAAALLLVLGLAIAGAILLARRISRPLAALATAANAIAAGDLSERELRGGGRDEIGDLVRAFLTMTAHLRNLVTQVSKAAEQLAASSEQLTASAEQCSQSTGQVATAVSEVAGGAANQVNLVGQSAQAVEKMNAAISRIVSTVGGVSTQSDAAAAAAQSGDEAVGRAASQMAAINQSVGRTGEVIRDLGASSQQIGEIVDVITGIAGQTNLLALNAAIEAARAGEAGRGFAVVADEVRKLAEQSETAAQKIGTIIADIRSGTETAVAAMGLGQKEVDAGTEVIAATGERFRQIAGMVRSLDSDIRDIAAGAGLLSQSSNAVVQAVSGVKTVAGDTAANTQTISAAVEQQSATMQQIAASSHALSEMAEELQLLIRQFRFS